MQKSLRERVADQGGEFSAGVNFAVRKQSDKVEGRSAAEAGAAVERRLALLIPNDVEEIVLDSQNRIGPAGRVVVAQQGFERLLVRHRQGCPLADRRQSIERELFGVTAQALAQFKHLVKVVARQRQHDARADIEVAKTAEKLDDLREEAGAADVVVVLRQALETDLVVAGRFDLANAFEILAAGWIAQDGEVMAATGGLLVQLEEMRRHQRVAPREADVSADVFRPAEFAELVHDVHALLQAHRRALGAVVAVLAVQIAGMGDVPLQHEVVCGARILGNGGGAKIGSARQARRESDQKSLIASAAKRVVNRVGMQTGGFGGILQCQLFSAAFEDEQFFLRGGLDAGLPLARVMPNHRVIVRRERDNRPAPGLDGVDEFRRVPLRFQQVERGVELPAAGIFLNRRVVRAGLTQPPFRICDFRKKIGNLAGLSQGGNSRNYGLRVRAFFGQFGPALGADQDPTSSECRSAVWFVVDGSNGDTSRSSKTEADEALSTNADSADTLPALRFPHSGKHLRRHCRLLLLAAGSFAAGGLVFLVGVTARALAATALHARASTGRQPHTGGERDNGHALQRRFDRLFYVHPLVPFWFRGEIRRIVCFPLLAGSAILTLDNNMRNVE